MNISAFNPKIVSLPNLEAHIIGLTNMGWTGFIFDPPRAKWRDDYRSPSRAETNAIATALGFKPCGHEKEWWSCDGPICHECRP